MIITIDTNKPEPGPFATDQEYAQFVMSNAALSYQVQYGTATPDEGITAAREAYNASLPPPQPAPEVAEGNEDEHATDISTENVDQG
jgi:hypothetical protein